MGVKRILIDCTEANGRGAIDFSRQPTGIPRVVLKYIEVGYDWGRRTGIPVMPVVPHHGGVVLRRPVPGKNPPPQLLELAAKEKAELLAAELAVGFLDYFCQVIYHLFYLIAALLPFTPIKVLAKWVDYRLVRKMKDFSERLSIEPYQLNLQPGDILFTPAYWHDIDPGIYRSIRTTGAQVVVLVHDLLPIIFDRFYPAPWCYEFKDKVTAACGYADAIFCVSDFTRSALIEFASRQKQKIPPLMTAYNGFEALADREMLGSSLVRPRIEKVFDGPLRPFLMVGTIEPKKGHLPTLKCFEAIWRAGYNRHLVIIGRRGWMEQSITDAIEYSPYLGKKLFWLTEIDDFDLATAYHQSHALILSSFGEGFGLPMIEASSFGKPTIAFDNPTTREILGDVGLFFRDAWGLVDRIVELEDAELYQKACDAALGVSWPSWNEYTPRVFDMLAIVADDPKRLPERVPKALS
jgi:glycosyltransferase involved in cell wall biosynthesis